MQLLQKASSIKDWIDRLAKQSSEYEKNKIHRKFKLVDVLSYGLELDLENNNNKVNFNNSSIQTITRRVDGRKLLVKKLRYEEFHSRVICKRRVI